MSPELAWHIDRVTRELVEEAYARAQGILEAIRPTLVAVAEHLCVVETIDGAELDAWLQRDPAAEPLCRRDAAIVAASGGGDAATG